VVLRGGRNIILHIVVKMMRMLIDLGDTQIQALDELSKQEKRFARGPDPSGDRSLSREAT
jgi:hypothetical protein